MIVLAAYTLGPGYIHHWLGLSINRTTTFPTLEAYWIMATWALIAVSELCSVSSTDPDPAHETREAELVGAGGTHLH